MLIKNTTKLPNVDGVKCTIHATMEAYDQLPYEMRRFLSNTSYKWSSIQALEYIEKHGVYYDWMCAILKKEDEAKRIIYESLEEGVT